MPKSPKKPRPRLAYLRRTLAAVFLLAALFFLLANPRTPQPHSAGASSPTSQQKPTASATNGRSSQSHSKVALGSLGLPKSVSVPSSRKYCDKRDDFDESPCIFDLGMNTGQDTRLYLASSPMSRVVAVEADPSLVANARAKFSHAIRAGRLKLLNVGLVGNATLSGEKRPKLSFWLNIQKNEYSSFRKDKGCRKPKSKYRPPGDTTFCRKIEMDTMSCSELIEEFGTPVYMKIDLEGMDTACIRALGNIPERDRPKYISKEGVSENCINILADLGYTRFKVVNQVVLQVGLEGDEKGQSGPWGEDAEDVWNGKKWHSREELLDSLPAPSSVFMNGVEKNAWYDLHATKDTRRKPAK